MACLQKTKQKNLAWIFTLQNLEDALFSKSVAFELAIYREIAISHVGVNNPFCLSYDTFTSQQIESACIRHSKYVNNIVLITP